jgi:tRNA(adenine34) deaminase
VETGEQLDMEMMGLALEEARGAASLGEVPVGAVIVDAGRRVLASAGNNVIGESDPAGHAEIRALRMAGKARNNYRLPGSTIYVTLEPCPMCASALVHARVARVVFGAADPKTGALLSRYTIGTDNLLNHVFSITPGVRSGECALLLRDFFQKRR